MNKKLKTISISISEETLKELNEINNHFKKETGMELGRSGQISFCIRQVYRNIKENKE